MRRRGIWAGVGVSKVILGYDRFALVMATMPLLCTVACNHAVEIDLFVECLGTVHTFKIIRGPVPYLLVYIVVE